MFLKSPQAWDLCVFDFGVNAGTGRAAKYLQRMIGTTVDGGIGPNTLKTLEAYVQVEGLAATIDTYQANRQEYYEKLSTFEERRPKEFDCNDPYIRSEKSKTR